MWIEIYFLGAVPLFLSALNRPHISILAAIALPAYQNYTQRSANNACLGEAKAWMSIRVTDIATGTEFTAYEAKACEKGPIKTTEPTESAKGTAIANDKQKDEFIAEETLYFSPHTRGTKGEWQPVICKTKSGNCEVKPKTT